MNSRIFRFCLCLLMSTTLAMGGIGCNLFGGRVNQAMHVPVQEEFVAPPNDPRYTTPPESAYRNPPNKKLFGSQNQGGGGITPTGGNIGQ